MFIYRLFMHLQKWVVWVNAQRVSDCPNPACYLTMTADNVTGPYTYTGPATLTTPGGVGDLDLFVDDDGQGYVVATRIGAGVPRSASRRVVVERLRPDFLAGVEASETFGPSFIEAPTLFRRGDVYYVFTGGCTCFGLGGAGVVVNTASSPLGPWTTRTNALDPGCSVGNGCSPGCSQRHGQPVTQAQQNYVIRVGGAASGSNATAFVWTGDRWQTGANDTGAKPPGLKGWDYQYWVPLMWDEASNPPVPEQLSWVNEFSI